MPPLDRVGLARWALISKTFNMKQTSRRGSLRQQLTASRSTDLVGEVRPVAAHGADHVARAPRRGPHQRRPPAQVGLVHHLKER